jgi:hypothetical protein
VPTPPRRRCGARSTTAWPAAHPRCACHSSASRGDLLDELAGRLEEPPARLSGFDREVMLARAARDARLAGAEPPFAVRPGLVAEMLALYDALRRQLRTVARFEEFLTEELEASDDRGAVRMLAQTRFLAESFRGYEALAASSGALDEHVLRDRLLDELAARPLRRVVITVTDRVADPAGLWPADLDLLTRLPGLAQLDVVATETRLAGGWLERLHAEMPGIEERAVPAGTGGRPLCLVPDADAWIFTSRDREEELAAFARRLKAERRAGRLTADQRVALVVRRPLPYLYLARDVLGRAGIPYETRDTLPLAAEPFAAAIDVLFEGVTSGFTRAATLAVLRSPHFRFLDGDAPLDGRAVVALDRALADARYLGDPIGRVARPRARPNGRHEQRGGPCRARRLRGVAQAAGHAGPVGGHVACHGVLDHIWPLDDDRCTRRLVCGPWRSPLAAAYAPSIGGRSTSRRRPRRAGSARRRCAAHG